MRNEIVSILPFALEMDELPNECLLSDIKCDAQLMRISINILFFILFSIIHFTVSCKFLLNS